MNGRAEGMCTVAGCRRASVGFVHRRRVTDSPEVYVGAPRELDDLAICAVHLATVMGERGAPELLPQP